MKTNYFNISDINQYIKFSCLFLSNTNTYRGAFNFGKTVFQILVNKDFYYYKLKLQAKMFASGPIKDTFMIRVVKNGRLELKKSNKKDK